MRRLRNLIGSQKPEAASGSALDPAWLLIMAIQDLTDQVERIADHLDEERAAKGPRL